MIIKNALLKQLHCLDVSVVWKKGFSTIETVVSAVKQEGGSKEAELALGILEDSGELEDEQETSGVRRLEGKSLHRPPQTRPHWGRSFWFWLRAHEAAGSEVHSWKRPQRGGFRFSDIHGAEDQDKRIYAMRGNPGHASTGWGQLWLRHCVIIILLLGKWPLSICRVFPGGSDGKGSACQGRRGGFDLWFGNIPWRGNSNPLQYSCLGNPIDRGAWWATVLGVAKNQAWLSEWAHTRAHKYVHTLFKSTNVWDPKFSLEGVSLFPEEPRVLSNMMALAEQHLLIVYWSKWAPGMI